MDENARLRAALERLIHAVCGETGFAECVRRDSGKAYPWPALDAAEAEARAALTPASEAPKGGEGGGSMWTGMGPNSPAPRLDPNCQCICHTQPGVMHVAACCSTPAPGADFKAEMMRAAEIINGSWLLSGIVKERLTDTILAEAEKITSSDAGGAHGCAVQTSQPGEVPASASPAPLTLRAGKRYRDGHGEVKGPMHAIFWENGEEMLTDSYVVWHPDGTLAGGTRDDKRSLVAEVE